MSVISKLGFCKYKIEGDNISNFTVPDDVINGKGINLTLNYTWTTTTECTISLSWYPILLNNEGALKGTILESDKYLKVNNNITLKLGNRTFTSNKTLSTNNIDDEINIDDEVVENITGTSFPVEFVYSYTSDDPDESNITYYLEIKTKIFRPNPYDENVVFTKNGINELLEKIKNYPITSITEISDTTIWNNYTQGKPCLQVTYGDTTKEFSGYKKADDSNQTEKTIGFQYIPVGSNITFPEETLPAPSIPQATGTIRININGITHEIPVHGLVGQGNGNITLNGTTVVGGHLLPSKDAVNTNGGEWNIGSFEKKWHTGYFKNLGNSTEPIENIYITTGRFDTINIWNGQNTNPKAYIDLSTYINNAVTYDGDHPLEVTNTTNGVTPDNTTSTSYSGNSSASIHTAGGIYATKDIWARRVFNAVFNDYAECRTTINLTPGHVVIDQDDGSLICSSARLQPGAQIISDTYGHLMGSTETATTPIAVAGRVLAYTYQPRENYHAGMAVCSAPGGTVDIMTREEIRNYPDSIIGIVSEIPQYEVWGSNNVKVDGRIWIKVK